MDDEQIAHLAGVVDSLARITVHVMKNERYSLDYEFRASIRVRLPYETDGDEMLIGKVLAYCDERGVKHGESREDRFVIEIREPESIERFLSPMMAYLVRQHGDAMLMLEEIVPAIERGEHTEKEGLINLLEISEPLRSESRKGEGHTPEEFREMWGIA